MLCNAAAAAPNALSWRTFVIRRIITTVNATSSIGFFCKSPSHQRRHTYSLLPFENLIS